MRLINALWMSFYSRPFYRQVSSEWKGVGFLYLCILALIQTIVACAQLDAWLDLTMRDYAPAIVQQIPAITIRNGEAGTVTAQAYQVKDPQTGRLLALIDTSLDRLPAQPADIPLFVGKKGFSVDYSLLFLNQKSAYASALFSDMRGEVVIQQTKIAYWLKQVSDWAALFYSPFILVGLLIVLILHTLFFSLFTWITLRNSKVQLSYSAILRLTAVSLSPALLLSTAFNVFFPAIPEINFICVLLVFIFISYAVHAVKKTEQDLKDDQSAE